MGMMDWLDNRRYLVALRFKTERKGVDCIMAISEYRRMVNDYRRGKTTGTYEMILDGVNAEMTYPLQELDTVHAALEVTE